MGAATANKLSTANDLLLQESSSSGVIKENRIAQIKTINLSWFTNEVTCHIDIVSYGHGVNYLQNAYIITLAYSRDVNNNNNILYYTFWQSQYANNSTTNRI